MKEFITHGGLGSRLKPLSDYIPKGFIPFCSTSTVDSIIQHFDQLEDHDIFMSIPKKDKKIPQLIEANGYNIQTFETTSISPMKDLALLLEKYDEPIFLWWGDSFASVDVNTMVNVFNENSNSEISIIGLQSTTNLRDLKHWGTVELDSLGFTINHPLQVTQDHGFIKGGVFIFHPSQLHKMKRRADENWDMSKIINTMIFNKEFIGIPSVQDKVNINYGEDIITAINLWYKHNNNHKNGLFGENIYWEGRVDIQKNTSIGNNVILMDGVYVENSLILDNSVIGTRATILNSIIGPNTFIPKDSFIRRKMVVDNLVEILTENNY